MPIIRQLIHNNWPYWLPPEQLWIEPGLWELAKFVIYYNEHITIPAGKIPSHLAKAFESWAISFGARPSDQGTPNDPRRVFPVLVDIAEAVTFVEARGTSKGNTHFIHFGLEALLSFLRRNPHIDPSTIAIISSYSKQTSLWIKALARYPELKGIRVITVNSFQGWEADFILWDMTVSANAGGHFQWLADAKRVCISLARHRSGLTILGDSCIFTIMNQPSSARPQQLTQCSWDDECNTNTGRGRNSIPVFFNTPLFVIPCRFFKTGAASSISL